MREDLIDRLEELQEKLFEAMLVEANPENWPGGKVLPKDLNRDERGDRYWCKKNAAATMTLLNKTISLEYFRSRLPVETEAAGDEVSQEEVDLERNMAKCEKLAEKQLERFQSKFGVGHA